jgi:hypothetical protein
MGLNTGLLAGANGMLGERIYPKAPTNACTARGPYGLAGGHATVLSRQRGATVD